MARHHALRFSTPPTIEDIEALAERAVAELPPRLAAQLHGVGIIVEDAADDATLAELGVDAVWELTGLYRGTPLGQRSVGDITREPDLIFLYREPILLEWIETGEDLFGLIRTVVIHEIAHHFGFSDEEIATLEG